MSWFQAYGNYVRRMVDGRALLMRGTLNALAAQLDPTMFVRISRSIVVNVRHVETVDRQANGQCVLRLVGGRAVQSSRRYRRALRGALGQHIP